MTDKLNCLLNPQKGNPSRYRHAVDPVALLPLYAPCPFFLHRDMWDAEQRVTHIFSTSVFEVLQGRLMFVTQLPNLPCKIWYILMHFNSAGSLPEY